MSNLHSIDDSVAMHEVGSSPGIGNASNMLIISPSVTALAFGNNTDSINTSTAVTDVTMCRFPMIIQMHFKISCAISNKFQDLLISYLPV